MAGFLRYILQISEYLLLRRGVVWYTKLDSKPASYRFHVKGGILVAGQQSSAAKRQEAAEPNWNAIANSNEFKSLLSAKKKFIIPNVIFFMIFYLTLPVSTAYFTFLNEKAIGALNWAYLFAFAQFIMTWVLCMTYSKKANKFDEQAEQIKQQALRGK